LEFWILGWEGIGFKLFEGFKGRKKEGITSLRLANQFRKPGLYFNPIGQKGLGIVKPGKANFHSLFN